MIGEVAYFTWREGELIMDQAYLQGDRKHKKNLFLFIDSTTFGTFIEFIHKIECLKVSTTDYNLQKA